MFYFSFSANVYGAKSNYFEAKYSALRFDFVLVKLLALIQVFFVMSVVFALAFTGNGLSNNSQIYTPSENISFIQKVWRVSDKSNKTVYGVSLLMSFGFLLLFL